MILAKYHGNQTVDTKYLQSNIQVFWEDNATKEEVREAGENLPLHYMGQEQKKLILW